MGKLSVSALMVLLAACASSRTANQDTPAVQPSSEAASTGPSGPAAKGPSEADRHQASAEVANARARLREAQRELEIARSESAAADADSRGARAQVDAAARAMDSIARARAAEVARAAEIRGETARAHLDYATKLVAARQADVDSARLASGQTGTAVSVAGTGSSTDARSALNAARQHAAQLGEVALEAQRRWEEATQRARALAGDTTGNPAVLGTGSNTGPGAPSPQTAVPSGSSR